MQPALGIAICLVAVFQPVSSALVPPPHYDGVITLGPERDEVSASLRISLKVPASSEYRLLLGRSFKIAHIEAEGATVTVEDTEQPFPGILQAIILRTAARASRDVQVRVTYAGKLGVDTDNMLVSQPDSGEQALEIAEVLIRSGAVDVLVVDSVAALVPRSELEGEMGDAQMGMQARLMSQALRKLTGIVAKSKTSLIFINQLREKIGVM